MRILPNIGAEQPLSDTSRLSSLHPFTERAMATLFPGVDHYLVDGTPIEPFHTQCDYLPETILRVIEPTAVLAFLNTSDVVKSANVERKELVGSRDAMTFHRRDWLFNYQLAQDTPWLGAAACFDFTLLSREEVIARARNVISQKPRLQENRTWKPFFSASGSGRCAGQGLDLGRDEENFILNTLHSGLILEPWVNRLKDLSTQLWLSDNEIHWLSSTVQKVSPAGRYLGLSATWTGTQCPVARNDVSLEATHLALAKEVWAQGYRGPLGIDGFDYRESCGSIEHRICEINARFTMGHLLIGIECTPSHQAHSPNEVVKLELKTHNSG